MPHSVKLRSHQGNFSTSITKRRACACNLCTTGGLQAYLEYVYLDTRVLKIIRRRSFTTACSRF
jgi:hypothetical protein